MHDLDSTGQVPCGQLGYPWERIARPTAAGPSKTLGSGGKKNPWLPAH